MHVKLLVRYNEHMVKVGEYLKKQRELNDMSLRDAGTAAGLSHVHVKEIEDGVTAPSFDKVMRILKAYHSDVQKFLRETGFLPPNVEPANLGKLRKIPIISWVTAGKWEEVGDSFQPEDAEDWTETDVKGEHVFALRVKGDSMEPEFYEGDIIIVNPHVRESSGDYVVVKNDEEEALLKQLKKYGKQRILHPLNPKYADIELSEKKEYRVIGRIVKKEKRY